jgi:pimeloyl-ACP methyl ester carboxylesterase
LCELLVARGYHVIRFDNRDAGRSTHGEFPPPSPVDLLARRWHRDQYTLADLAADTVGLLDALELPRAHLVGMSMDGMIAQTVAARHPARVGSSTSIMSTTGARVGRPAWSTWRLMLGRPARTRDEHIERAVRMYRHIRSAAYPFDESAARTTAARTWDRDPSPAAGVGRQLAGILKSGDRTGELRAVTAPTLCSPCATAASTTAPSASPARTHRPTMPLPWRRDAIPGR